MKTFFEKKPILCYVIIAFLFTWTFQVIGIFLLHGDYKLNKTFLILLNISSFGPFLSAIITTFFVSGRKGLVELFQRTIKVKINWLVYVAAFFVFPLVLFLIYTLFGLRVEDNETVMVFLTLVIAIPINSFVVSVIIGIGPLGEEIGWRGFLLPKLLKKYGDYKSSLILGLVWAFWHLPLFLFSEFRGDIPIWMALFLYPFGTICLAYIMTKLHRWSGGSIFLAILFHGVVNYAMDSKEFWDLDKVSQIKYVLLGYLVMLTTAAIFWGVDLIKKRYLIKNRIAISL
ncbi:CPBP family intramembrane metalloprotease [Candidatus Dojkabacteria bacterium]|nr:CPBP family intramembrane metalloprotease [Candidatus Dojkabacteria bacterium]